MSIDLATKDMQSLKEQFGEAFYLLDSDRFRQNFVDLRAAFSAKYPRFNIAYSYKTNYTPKLCKIVNDLGGYAEVVSEMELELALRIGVKPEHIIWNGPVKNPTVVEDYLLDGGVINIDSLDEAVIIQGIVAKHPDHIFKLGIRCNYDVGDGVLSRFGLDIDCEEFNHILSFITSTPNVKLTDLHCHFAKRNIEYWPARAKGMIDLINRIGIIPERIDLGGALFGHMPASLKEQFSTEIPAYTDYARASAALIAEAFGKNGPELIIEPGSALVGDCMKFIGTVKSIKCIRGKYFASVLGSQKNISMIGVNPPIEVVPGGSEQHDYRDMDLVGFTCIEGDVLYRNYCGRLAVGDSIIISNCGSYSLVMKPPFILPNFPVIDVSGNSVEVIKRAETFDDIFHTFCF